jgi:glycosyltransferase involved in cell wall biosynthesis
MCQVARIFVRTSGAWRLLGISRRSPDASGFLARRGNLPAKGGNWQNWDLPGVPLVGSDRHRVSSAHMSQFTADCRPSTAQAAASVRPLDCSAVLTHHWLVRVRGGEKVLQALCELAPGAPIYTLIHEPRGIGGGWPPVRASLLNRLPGARRHYPKLLALLALAARSMRLPEVDLVLCSDAAVAKAMRPHPRSKVVCYCHSPMRYAWDEALRGEYCRTLPLTHITPFMLSTALARRIDAAGARRVDQFVANSRHVAARIKRDYGRDSIVVYPPVDLPDEPATGPREGFYLCVGHHVPYKRLDLAVEACVRLGRRLVVIGDGPEVKRLRVQARRQGAGEVSWLGWQTPEAIADCYRRACGLLFPGEEDFGIVPVEAMAHGCPVIACGVGGATETVIDGRTGVLFERQDAGSLVEAMLKAEAIEFEPRLMHEQVQRFSRARFLAEMAGLLRSVLTGVREGRD